MRQHHAVAIQYQAAVGTIGTMEMRLLSASVEIIGRSICREKKRNQQDRQQQRHKPDY